MVQNQTEFTKSQIQNHIQMAFDTHERLLIALERYERITEKFNYSVGIRKELDGHTNENPEDNDDAEMEVHLQIMALLRVKKPTHLHSPHIISYLLKDFLCWFGGRSNRKWALVDNYAFPSIRVIAGDITMAELIPLLDNRKKFQIDKNLQFSQADVTKTMEILSTTLLETDELQSTFEKNETKEASTTTHQRGTLAQGIYRLLLFETTQYDNSQYLQEFLPKYFPMIKVKMKGKGKYIVMNEENNEIVQEAETEVESSLNLATTIKPDSEIKEDFRLKEDGIWEHKHDKLDWHIMTIRHKISIIQKVKKLVKR